MSFLKNIFTKKERGALSYQDFWDWFRKNEGRFHRVVKDRRDLEKEFFRELSAKLKAVKEGYYYLTGMCDADTVELILTADGDPKNIVFVEELVDVAPKIGGWMFTALKPPSDINKVGIKMADYKFDKDNIRFYSNDDHEYPDEIDITVVHDELNDDNKSQIIHGVSIFLDNYLGELDFACNIDQLSVVGREEAKKELVPIDKLKDFLTWRQKEFIERYDGVRYDTDNDQHSMLEAKLKNGNTILALINTELLKWERKASHPWVAVLTIGYDGRDNNGMPDGPDYEVLNHIENEILQELKDFDGYLNIGRETGDDKRRVFFACKDFRRPSKALFNTQTTYMNQFEMEYEIFKDKYWRSFEKFNR